MHNVALRQCLLEIVHASIGHLGVVDEKECELVQPFQVLQSGIGEQGVLEIVRIEFFDNLEVGAGWVATGRLVGDSAFMPNAV